MLSSPPYVELRAHTAFSFGDGAVAPETLVEHAAALGYHTLGITDTADVGGIVRAAERARTLKGNPLRILMGAELRVDDRPLALLARTEQGCHNLCRLITHARVGPLLGWAGRGYARPRGLPSVTWRQLESCADGLYCLTGQVSGTLATLVRDGRLDDAKRWLRRCEEVFDGHVSIEVQDHRTGGDERALAEYLIALAREIRVPWVVTTDPRYVDSGGRLIHDILTALRANLTLDEAAAAGVLHPNGEWQLQSPYDVAARWTGYEEGIAESVRIASLCDFSVKWLRPPLPNFPELFAPDLMEFLRARVYEGARVRWGTPNSQQNARIEEELEVIQNLGFAGFFLVMWDAVRHARETLNVLCQGRGSAANSVVAYCLGITAVDPVAHKLLFERFLSGVRVPGKSGEYTEAPDIDVDIEHNRREEVVDYMYKRYQRDQSAITCTIQTYRAPNALLDTMRALGFPPQQAQSISKWMHRDDPVEGAELLEHKLAKQHDALLDDRRGRMLLRAMRSFAGLPRMRGTHVGGFVLSSQPLGHYLPIEHTTMGRTIIQFDKDDLDIIGVPKFDFLGLGALTQIRHAFDAIHKRTGRSLQLYHLPTDDQPTFQLIQRGDTVGMFQIESRAQISSIVHTLPDKMYDLVVQIALVRPGPIQGKFVSPYTKRRRGQEDSVYLHPALEPILKRTKGIPIFQEQAMRLSMVLGGFPAAKADQLRRTMGNIRKKEKLAAVLDELKTAMIDNKTLDPRVTQKVAEQIKDDLMTFANYGFPESHAWSFALIAYATAYLKKHYPAEFYLGLLNAYPMGFYSPSTLIHDARRHGVDVQPPCLAQGAVLRTTEPASPESPYSLLYPIQAPVLRIGWRHIRGVGKATIDRIERMREAAPFRSIADVVERVGLNRSEAMQFARADTFRTWEPDRRKAAWEALRAVGDTLPLAPVRKGLHEPRELDARERIFLDYHATGICVSGHPMEHLRSQLDDAGILNTASLASAPHGSSVLVAGLVTVRQRPETAGGTIFLLLEDEFGYLNVVVSKRMVDRYEDVVRFAPFVVVQGKVERDGGSTNIIGITFRVLPVVQKLTHAIHNFR